jgi:hypothetical protein
MAFWEGPILTEIRGGARESREFVFLDDSDDRYNLAQVLPGLELTRERNQREWKM